MVAASNVPTTWYTDPAVASAGVVAICVVLVPPTHTRISNPAPLRDSRNDSDTDPAAFASRRETISAIPAAIVDGRTHASAVTWAVSIHVAFGTWTAWLDAPDVSMQVSVSLGI